MAVRVRRGNGGTKGSFANSKRVVTAPVRLPTPPSRYPKQWN